ncbi:MAG: 2-phospho-L-lactate transferase [Ilumatobacteraceae bacterium]|jgi:LPPG:FO 2-phospho-L-lactate transferase|nr:2-phospho-L-lactate transferase [Ilumatobacteraceae bacterium]
MISVLAGGVGAARFLRGLCLAVDPARVVAVVNTGDDTELHGLSISPDIDTVIYTLANAIDPERGWGLRDETWRAMASLERFTDVRPAGSRAAPTWFNLGDQDLATHFYRTARLQEGASLTEVTDEIRRSFELLVNVIPMTDDRVRTLVTIAECDSPVSGETISFQEYFVRHRHSLPVASVTFDGALTATLNPRARLHDSERIIIAPSNPIVSIGPLRALAGVDDLLRARRNAVVAISPIVAGAALKGPADRMLRELGMEPTVVGVARLYSEVCGTLIIDTRDAHLASAVEAEGLRCLVTDTIMSDPNVARDLAALTLT